MEQEEDEISLVDLLVVLLKHWKMIVIVPVVVALAAGVYLFFKSTPKNEGPTETSLTLTINPLVKQFSGTVNLEDLISNFYLKDLDLLYQALKDVEIKHITSIELPPKSEEALYIVKSLLIDGKTPQNTVLTNDDTPYVIENTNGVIRITVRFSDKDQSAQFLRLVTDAVKVKISDLLLPIAKKEVEDYEKLLNEGSKSASNLLQNSLAVRYSTYSSAQRYIQGDQIPIILSNPTTVKLPVTATSSKLILAVSILAALFFTVFLAFVLEAIENVRKDPEAMAKIRSALKKEPRAS
jgi:capsular polysaccharide biosynthesis protein